MSFVNFCDASMTLTAVDPQKHQTTTVLLTMFGRDISREKRNIIDGQYCMKEVSKDEMRGVVND